MRIFVFSLLVSALVISGVSLSPATGISVPKAQAAPTIEPIELKEVDNFINAGGKRVVMIYASWCPYCKKQMRGFSLMKSDYPIDHILPVSNNVDLDSLERYIQKQEDYPFDAVYNLPDKEELKTFIKSKGGSFSGGIPYFAVFQDGKYQEEFLGLTHPKDLAK